MVDVEVAVGETGNTQLRVAFAVDLDVGSYVALATWVLGVQVYGRHRVGQEQGIGKLQGFWGQLVNDMSQNCGVVSVRVITGGDNHVRDDVAIVLLHHIVYVVDVIPDWLEGDCLHVGVLGMYGH